MRKVEQVWFNGHNLILELDNGAKFTSTPIFVQTQAPQVCGKQFDSFTCQRKSGHENGCRPMAQVGDFR